MSKIVSIVWRSILVGLAYTIAQVTFGGMLLSPESNISTAASQDPSLLFLITFVAGFLMGVIFGPIAQLVNASRARSAFIWTTVLFLNLVSVLIEGYFFSPGLLPLSVVPRLLLLQLLSAVVCGLTTSYLFRSKVGTTTLIAADHRPLYSWAWRFTISAASYVAIYFLFGAINYELVTKAYYEANSSLAVPPFDIVLKVECFRALLIVTSVLPLIKALHLPRKKLLLISGTILFVIGGVVPLSLQTGIMPTPLLITSGIEIFFQNFLTGVVAALLLGASKPKLPDWQSDVFYHLEIEEEAL